MAKTSNLDGSGTLSDPYLIQTIDEFHLILEHPSEHYKLVSSLDFTGLSTESISIAEFEFSGRFDGNGYTVRNITLDGSEDFCGLFGNITNEGIVENITVEDPTIGNLSGAGVIAGLNEGQITNCQINGGTLSGSSSIGGICGVNSGSITECNVFDVTVSGGTNIGGIVGASYSTNITTVSCKESQIIGDHSAGGIAGFCKGTELDVVTTADCVIGSNSAANVGGIAGYLEFGQITDYEVDTVTVESELTCGGVVGGCDQATIKSGSITNVSIPDCSESGICIGQQSESKLSLTEIHISEEYPIIGDDLNICMISTSVSVTPEPEITGDLRAIFERDASRIYRVYTDWVNIIDLSINDSVWITASDSQIVYTLDKIQDNPQFTVIQLHSEIFPVLTLENL